MKKWDLQGGSSKPDIRLGAHSVSLGTVRCMESTSKVLRVANVGRSLAYMRFTSKVQGLKASPQWLSVSPSCCLLEPGYTQNFSFTTTVDSRLATKVFGRDAKLEQLLVLRLEDGPEYYINVFARLAHSALSTPLATLVCQQGKARSMLGVPMELYLLINGIVSSGILLDDPAAAANKLFNSSGCQEEVEKIIEWLGTERDIDPQTRAVKACPPLPNVSPRALANGTLELFRRLPEPIVSPLVLLGLNFSKDSGGNMSDGMLRQFYFLLPSINHNVFLYFISFLRYYNISFLFYNADLLADLHMSSLYFLNLEL